MIKKEVNKFFINNLLKVWGVLFGVLGAITVVLPLNEVLTSWNVRMITLLGIIVLVVILTVATTFIVLKRNANVVYSKEKTLISFEYNDFEKIMNGEKNESSVVVVPINTELDFLGAIDKISHKSVHGVCLKYLKQNGVTIDRTVISNTEYKKNGIEEGSKGKIGDWFLVKPNLLGIDSNVQFLFIEVNEMEKKGTYYTPKGMTKENYYLCLDSLMVAIADVTGVEDKIFIPLIGAGNANVGKTKDIMFFMEGFLRFNKSKLLREIHVVIPEDRRDEAPIYMLRTMK